MSKLFETIQKDLVQAQKDKDAEKVSTLRLLLSEAKNKQIELGKELSDEDVLAVLKSEGKKRKDSIEQFEKGGRDDLVEQEKTQLAILETYLPEQMSEEDVEKVVREVVQPGQSMSDMGPVMGQVMGRLKGAADGSVVNEVVKRVLGENA